MKQEDFDRIIKEKLNGIKPPANASSWDLLANRLDQVEKAEANYARIESQMKHKLKGISPQYQQAHWKLLAERMQASLAFKKRIALLKVIELSMVFLLMFSINNYFSSFDEPASQLLAASPATLNTNDNLQNDFINKSDQQIAQNAALKLETQSQSAETNKSKLIPENNEVSGNLIASNAREKSAPNNRLGNNSRPKVSSISNQSAGLNQINEKAKRSDSENIMALNSAPINLSGNDNLNKNSTLGIEKVDANLIEEKNQVNSIAVQSANDELIHAETAEIAHGTVEDLSLLPVLPLNSLETKSPAQVEPFLNKEDKKRRIWTPTLGLICGFSNNEIQSPSQGLFSYEFDKQNWISPELGITYLIDNGLFGMESGISYSYIQYKGIPRDNSVHFLKVPLNLRIIPLSNDGYSLYFLAGATLHIGAFAKYDRPVTMDLGTGSNPGQSNEYDKGLFQHGDYKSNTYYTYNVGVGFERYYNNNIRIFGQLTRNSSLFDDRFSPSLNKIKATSLQIGMRIPLN